MTTRWAILTGEYPPQPGGVSDYTRQVAGALAAAGDGVTVFAPQHDGGSEVVAPGVDLFRLPDHFGPRGLLALESALGEARPDRILVQYVPHAFGWRAMNLPFAAWLACRARRFAPLSLMVHELNVSFRWRPSDAALWAAHAAMGRLAAGAADRVYVSIPAWGARLRRLCPGSRPAEWLPIPTNLPTDAVETGRGRPQGGTLIGHFGTYRQGTAGLLEPVVVRLLAARRDRTVLLLGRGGACFRNRMAVRHPEFAGQLSAPGELSADEVAVRLKACDILLQPFPDGLSTRRTSAIAGLALGRPIVSNLGELSEALWQRAGCVALAASADPDALAIMAEALLALPEAERASMGHRAAALYRDRFSLERTLARLRGVDAVNPPPHTRHSATAEIARMHALKPLPPQPRVPRRLAVYGYVDEHAGSLCAGHYLALRELLRRGTRIDLYAIEGWVKPGGLAALPGLSYYPVRREICRAVYRALDRLPLQCIRSAARSLFGQAAKYLDWEPIGEEIRRAHARDPYDALVVLGLLSPWKVSGLLTVSWTQGPPNGESAWYRRNVRACAKFMGPAYVPLVAGGYLVKHAESRLQCPLSDVIIAGSRWSVGEWRRYGVKLGRLTVLPYPVDLDRFRPAASPADKPAGEVLFLHIGRIVPRKRVDLLLDALPLVTREEPGARLLVVGRNQVPWVASRLNGPSTPAGVEYRPAVDHRQIPALIARADCVVQTSENENFGSAVAEALACGRPVLVGPTNGTKDFAGEASVVFDEYTPQSVARGMLEVIRRLRTDRARLLLASRTAAERFLDPPAVADQLCQVVTATPESIRAQVRARR
jgi:glycosyltransferase involved in cell wall biosynthesis